MPTKRAAGGRQGRAELLKEVIKNLVTTPADLERALSALDLGDLLTAYEAGQKAINRLKVERCNRLRVSEVAVLIELGRRQTDTLLSESFRPQRKLGVDFMLMKLTENALEARQRLSMRGGRRNPWFVYRRDSIQVWWDKYGDVKSRNARTVALESKAVQEAIIHRKIAALTRQLANLQEVNRSTFAFAINDKGQIVDNVGLPIHDAHALAACLEAGGRIEHLTLTEAMTEWVWSEDGGSYEAWKWIWSIRVEEERARLDELQLTAERIHADGRSITLARKSDERDSSDDPGRKRSRS